MRTSEAFPSIYITAGDLQGRDVTVKIREYRMEEVGKDKDRKPVLYFEGTEKGLILNVTNANTIEAVYGDEMDDWIGAEIILYPTMTDWQGKQVPAIRIKMPRRSMTNAPNITSGRPSPRQSPQMTSERNEVNPPPDDDIPF